MNGYARQREHDKMPTIKTKNQHADQGLIYTAASPYNKITPVPIGAVTMGEGFWKTRIEANRTKGIPALLAQLEEHGTVDNFRRMTGRKDVDRQGPFFTDSDLYKWMEGAALVLASTPDAKVKQALDGVIDDVVAAQRPDGYLNTFFEGALDNERFRNLGHEHELYCAGHLFQAAVAHYRATGETKLLDCATRFADYLVKNFGPGKIEQADGHPEIEMALVELYRTTGKREYLNLAGFFISLQNFHARQKIGGHAVREAYISAGAADYYAETGDAKLRKALDIVWKDVASSKVYITGGLGSRHAGEAVGDPFELPNERAYAETCAAIANGMWNFRMLGLDGAARYGDMLERALYNGFLSGVSQDTTHWFYVNPLACWGTYQREPWFGCTCCPTNVVRTLAAIPGYLYGTSKDGVWIHLYDNSNMDWHLQDGKKLSIEQKTRYPWDGRIRIAVNPESESDFELHLRIPEWCGKASVEVNGSECKGVKAGEYFEIKRAWKPGDVVELHLKMPVELMEADQRVADDRGQVAIQRGPLVYCLESVDNPDAPLRDLRISEKAGFKSEFKPELVGGVVTIATEAEARSGSKRNSLYHPLSGDKDGKTRDYKVTAIPYFAWANRGPSEMEVWIPLSRS